MKPLIFITGFLGAGKTTLLRKLSKRLSDREIRVDVILNDYVNAGMEASVIGESTAHITPLDSGCACCESLDELVAVCRAANEGKGELLLLELNGTADPLPILETFSVLQDKLPFFPRIQICLIDARFWGNRGDLTVLEKRQLETAGYWILSHGDKVEKARVDQIAEDVASVFPHCTRMVVADFEKVLLTELEASKGIENTPRFSGEIGSLRHDHAHQLSHRFTGCSLPLPAKVRGRSIEKLISELPSWVIRAKALVKLVEEPGNRWLYQRTGSESMQPPLAIPNVCNVPASLICIGPSLDENELKSRIQHHFGTF